MNSAEANGPFVGGDQFEMALYTVKDGKIVREQFFSNAPETEA